MFVFVFFFKHKTAYELRISDWSSDVLFRSSPTRCSASATSATSTISCSWAPSRRGDGARAVRHSLPPRWGASGPRLSLRPGPDSGGGCRRIANLPRQEARGVGKSVSVGVDSGGRRMLKNKKEKI